MYLLHCKDMKYSGKREHLNGRILSFWDHKMEHDYGIRPVYLPPLCIMHPPLRSPLRFSASRACQSALIKQFVTKAGAKVFLYRGFELIAFFESVSAYLRYWGGDFHCGKAVAPIERAITYTGHPGRDCRDKRLRTYISCPRSLSCQPKGIEIFPGAPGAKNLCRLAKYPENAWKGREERGRKRKEHSLMTDYAPLFVIKNRGMMFPAPYFTLATMALNASGWLTARSARTLRLISMPPLCSRPINWE